MTTKLPTYDKYKPSGVEWLGEIPEHWEVVRLKYLFTILKRIAGKLGFDVLSITQTGIKVKDTESGEGQLSMDYSKYQLVNEGNFAMNHMDLLTGYVDVSKYDGVISPDYRVFDLIDPNSDKKYMLLLLQLGYKSRIFYAHGQGVSMLGRWRFPSENFNNFLFPVPPKEEQTAIAQFLDRKTALIDQAIDIKQKQIELLKERRQILIHQAVTGGLNPEVKMKDSGVEWIGEVPEHWEVRQLRRLFNFLNTKRIPLSAEERGKKRGEYPYYGASGIIDYIDDYIFEETLILIAEDGANLLSKSTPLAFVASGKYWVNNHAHIIRPIYKGFTYWAELLSAVDYTPSISGAAQPKLTMDRLASIKLPVPPENEIEEICIYIQKNAQKIATTITLKQQEIAKLQEYKATLINSAVTGKIKVGSHAQ